MRFFRRSLIGLFLLSLTLGLLALAGDIVYGALEDRWADAPAGRPNRERVFSVNVITLEPTSIAPVLTSFGEVASRRTLDIRAPIAGRIVALMEGFEEGGTVTEGQLLAQLDPADAQTAVDVAQTDLIEAEADLREAERAAALARDELGAAQSQAKLRSNALLRQQDLLARGVGTEANVEIAELEVSSAEQAVLSRRQAAEQAEAQIDQTRTLIDRRRINLENAKRLLADTEVYARFDGRLSDVVVTAGGLVGVNERMAQLVDPLALEVSFRVSTAQYTRLIDEAGALVKSPVEIVLDVFGAQLSVPGRLTRESAAVSEGTTGRLLFATIDTPRGLRPGDFVTVRIAEPELPRVVKVPATAVDAKGTVLVLGEEDRLEETGVELLRRQDDDVILRVRGLAGREIVEERSQLLGAGIKVRPVRPSPDGAETAMIEPEMVALEDDRRAKLVNFIENNNRMPDEVKARMLQRLTEPEVPVEMVQRIEARMGS